MPWLLLLLVLLPSWAAAFDPSVAQLVQQTYGPSREPCATAGPGDVVLHPGQGWERQIETASAGTRFFFTAGTYAAEFLDPPAGSTLKPQGCAAVTLKTRIRPRSNTTIAGLRLSHLTGTRFAHGVQGTVWFPPTSRTTGVIIRNNFITNDDHYNISLYGTHSNLLIEGNQLEFPRSGTAYNNVYIHGRCTGCTLRGNRLYSLGRESDQVQAYQWAGTWLITRNSFHGANGAPVNFLDIKYTLDTGDNRMHILENYFDGGQLSEDSACALDHNASDNGTGAGRYRFTLTVSGNLFRDCPNAVWDHRISQRSAAERADTGSRILHFRDNRIENGRDPGAQVRCESLHCHVHDNVFVRGDVKIGSGSWTPSDVTVHRNRFDGTTFTNPGRLRECRDNQFHQSQAPAACTGSQSGPAPAPLPPVPPAPAPEPPREAEPRRGTLVLWSYALEVHPRVRYELEIVRTAQGRTPTRQTYPLRPLGREACQAAIVERGADPWTPETRCALACLLPGEVTGKLFAVWLDTPAGSTAERSDPSNEADTTVQEGCESSPSGQRPPATGLVVAAPIVAGAAVVGTTGSSSSTPNLLGLPNRQCVDWKVVGPCLCGFPPHPCAQVSYWRPRWYVEVVKKPGDTTIPALGPILQAALGGTGIAHLGGGGAGNASGSGHTNRQYSEVHVYSLPDLFGGPCTGCAPATVPPMVHYASELDATMWRTATAPPGVPIPALLPVGVWGTLFPRSGNVIHGSPSVASGLQAIRALNIAFAPVVPLPAPEAHVILSPSGGMSTCMQLASPTMRQCLTAGSPPPLFEHGTGSINGTYSWIFWSKESCCVEAAQSTCGITLPAIGGHGANMCVIP